MRVRKIFRMCFLFLFLMAAFTFSANATEAEETSQEVIVKKISGKHYLYYKDTGKAVRGLKGLQEFPKGSKNYYYFRSSKGYIYANQWFSKNKKYYYADKSGKLKSGWQTIAKKTYYFNTKTLARTTGWKKLSKKYYYFNSKGQRITGWMKLKNYTYYLDPAANGVKTVGWKTINKKTYYFSSKGRLQTGLISVNGQTYYCDKKGVRKTGLITINGKKYYFDKKANGAMKTGWVTVSGKTYYMSNVKSRKGQAVTGWMQRGGSHYFFNSSGVMQKGWLTQNGKKYYLDPQTGKMLTGKQTISGKTYDFGKKGYITAPAPTGELVIKVNQGTNCITIYRGNTPIKSLQCSVGLNGATPNGTFKILDKLRWHELMGPSWGQYCSHITSDILFHSVPYNRAYDPRSLSITAYNNLGVAASHGCIRLNCASAKWIYDNCPVGTKVIIFRGTSANDPLGRPYVAPIRDGIAIDPTDPNVHR